LLAISGYPACGKSAALADFLTLQDSPRVWIELPRTLESDTVGIQIIHSALQFFLNCVSPSKPDIETALTEYLAENSLTVVIDNAELLVDPSATEFLLRIADTTQGRLSVLFAYAEDPGFTLSAQLSLVPTWRLPGMTVNEAVSMYEGLGIDVDASRRAFIASLCAQCDGHIGLLRLSRPHLESVSNTATLTDAIDVTNTEGSRQFIDAIVDRFVSKLSPSEQRLYLRLSVVFGSFTKEVAVALWEGIGDSSQFMTAWSRGRAAILEHVEDNLFRLPYLYRKGLNRELDEIESRHCHATVADCLMSPQGGVFSVDDTYHVVLHRLCANQIQDAVNHAVLFLGLALVRSDSRLANYLLPLFRQVLPGDRLDTSVTESTRLRFASANLACAELVQDSEVAAESAARMEQILTASSSSTKSDTANQLGWAQLLIYAMNHGEVSLCWRAVDCMESGAITDPSQTESMSVLLPVFIGYTNSPEEILRYIGETLARVQDGSLDATTVWGGEHLTELWRTVGARLYSKATEISADNIDNVHVLLVGLEQYIRLAVSCSLPALATCLNCARVLIEIDVVRDLATAVIHASEPGFEDLDDPTIQGLAYLAIGDAHRCSQDFSSAGSAYRASLSLLPESSAVDRLQATCGLTVSLARGGNLDDGLRIAVREITRHTSHDYDTARIAFPQLCFEAAAIAIAAGRRRIAAWCLGKAHGLLQRDRSNNREWPVLAQLAMRIRTHSVAQDSGLDALMPGFTYGLAQTIPGSENMLRCGPDMVLAHALAGQGLHRKALSFYLAASGQIEDLALRHVQATIMFHSAASIRDLRSAVTIAATILSTPRSPEMADSPLPYEIFMRDYLLGETVSIAAQSTTSPDATELIESLDLLEGIDEVHEECLHLLRSSLLGIKEAAYDGDAASLSRAFDLVIQHGALVAARSLAFTWCFRYLAGHPEDISIVASWMWRLSRLSITTCKDDDANLETSFQNQTVFWTPVGDGEHADRIRPILDALASTDGDILERANALDTALAEVCHNLVPHTEFFPEVGLLIRCGLGSDWIAQVRALTITQLLEWTLSPAIDAIGETLLASIELLANSLAIDEGPYHSILSDWITEVHELQQLAEYLLKHVADADASMQALISLRPYLARIASKTAANWFFVFRRIDDDRGASGRARLEQRCRYLSREAVNQFLEGSAGLSDDRATMLRLLGIDADGSLALDGLLATLPLLSQQRNVPGPILASAASEVSIAYEAAIHEIESIYESYRETSQFLTEDSEETKLALYFQWGTLQCTVGGARHRFLPDERETASEELTVAIDNLTHALSIAESAEDRSKAAIISSRLHVATATLGDAAAAEEHRNNAYAHAEAVADPAISKFLAYQDEIVMSLSGASKPLRLMSEDEISTSADGIMAASGWPPDRRMHVIDDMRKQNQVNEEKLTFCRHIEALQDLRHTESPSTIYARPTEHVCKCTLLGHETKIQHADIEAVINSMKRNYCEGCEERDPIQPQAK
jgi:hypothetical protein